MSQPFTCIVLDYVDSLQHCYQALSHLPGFVLLESGDKLRGRYDIVSAYPYSRYVIDRQTPHLRAALDDFVNLLELLPSVGDLPFQGGAIGYVAYDLGAELAGLASQPQPTLEDMPLLDMGLYDWAIIADHQLKKVTLLAANRQAHTSALVAEVLTLWKQAVVESPLKTKTEAFIPLLAKEQYAEAFEAVQDALKAGRSYQVNLTQAFHAPYEGEPWQLYKAVCLKNPVPYAAFIRTDSAVILSFSPERLLLYDKGTLLTSPIKGTSSRALDVEEDALLQAQLLACPKNRAENVMIVDLLRNDLGRIAKPGSVRVTSLCAVQSYSAVHHLVSDIEADCLVSIHPWEAFMACFPGGSITGTPKLEAMRIIADLEPHARGIYCGSIGYFSHHGRLDTNIAIRTITARAGVLHLAAGGALVIDSNCEEEYQECYIKIQAIMRALSEV